MDSYKPVSCSFTDELEAIATLRRSADISYYNESGVTVSITNKIVDIYNTSGADYCKLANGTAIRLDRLTAVSVASKVIL